ncbi:MAG TPA: M1 family metallopeptidase [Acidimicrobiales bacterium]
MSADPYRLPRTVTPRHYDLTIAPDLGSCRFEGTTEIDVAVHETVREVVLNAIELDVHSVVVVDAAGRRQEGSTTLDEKLERATVTFPEPLSVGDATLTIASTGLINDQLRGFYRSTFTDADGTERVIATTQFESTDARRAFPCWDEPEHKATFQVRLLVPDGLLGLSNTAVVDQRPTEGGTWVTFDRTMKMSTYLVAFVVGPLVTTRPVDVDGVPLRVACVPGREGLADFALEVGAHALRFLAEYFAIPYPAGKLDLVALPDFAFGAMENVGCVTFRETALLVDRDNSSRLELERVADVVSHEIAHMWFGDLVTMKWWNGIWLNEAFATFMELTTVDAFRPEWERWVSFSTERGVAMVTDALASTRPIEYEVVSPEDAEGMFDVLTYQKGGAVLRMLETYLGPERFRDGIRLYLDRHRYANTETTDLWDAIEEATGEPVRSIMDSWIFQGGHPVVAASSDRPGQLTLRQQRFRYIPSPEDASVRWQVPILLRGSSEGHERLLLSDSTATVGTSLDDPVVVNAGGWGVFRTRYSGSLFGQVIAGFRNLDPIERFNLVSDTWAMVLAGQEPVGELLDLVALLGDERNPSVWEAALDALNMLYRVVPDKEAFSTWVRQLVGPVFATLGWEPAPGEDDGTAKLRGLLLMALGTIGEDPLVKDRARSIHVERTPVAPDLLAPIVSVVAWNGGPAEYEDFWTRIRQAPTPQEEVRYLFRLSAFPDPELLERTLDATLDEIRAQNGAFVVATALANRAAGREAWEWVTQHWDDILKRLPDNSHGRMLEGIVRLTDPSAVAAVADFLADHPIPSARKQVDQLLERQQVNAAFAARARDEVARWFNSAGT